MSEVTRAKIYSFAPFHSARGTLRFRRFTPHPHLTAIKRKNPRLGFFPNFFRFAPETSLNRDVMLNKISVSLRKKRREPPPYASHKKLLNKCIFNSYRHIKIPSPNYCSDSCSKYI